MAKSSEKMSLVRDRIKELRRVSASSLLPAAENWRKHGPSQKRHMNAVLEEIGFAGALVAREDSEGRLVLIDGHLRQDLVADDQEVPVLVLDVDEVEAEKILATYDPIGSFAEADRTKLEAIIRRVKSGNGNLRTVLDQIAARNRVIPPGHVPESKKDVNGSPDPPKKPKTQAGNMYRLGPHLALCGDSREKSTTDRLFGQDHADAIVTDPPYGVDYEGKTGEALTIDGDSHKELLSLLKAVLGQAYAISRTGAVWYVFGPTGLQMLEFAQALRELDVWRQTIIWTKDTQTLGRFDYHYQHETIFYGWKGSAGHTNNIGRSQTTLWECPRPKRSTDHPTMKPVELIGRMLRNSTDEGNVVYDPFGGSGSTLIACQQENRRCRTAEIDPRYMDVIVRRWEELTGEKAELIKD